MLFRLRASVAFGAVLVATSTVAALGADLKTIGQVQALIPEASTADEPSEQRDGQSGDTAFPFIGHMKPLATVGEIDQTTGMALTGYPDGHAAWLIDENTVRIAYQSESYATLSNETYPWRMRSGASFTGSHIHTIDFDRKRLAKFLETGDPASSMIRRSGHLFDRIYNVFGNEVLPRERGGRWGNQSRPDGSLARFGPTRRLRDADFFFQSLCAAHYEKANKYGEGIGFADDVWLASEEWQIQGMFKGTRTQALDTMGLASIVVDVARRTAYTVPALGQTGYEKMLPLNPGHPDYVVLALPGYNHAPNYRQYPAPLRVYVGRKNLDAEGNPVDPNGAAPERDKFLARNGLLYGRIYGMAVTKRAFNTLGLKSKMPMDHYMYKRDSLRRVTVSFFPTRYRWKGWKNPTAVRDTEMLRWRQEPPSGGEDFVFLLGSTKNEHAAVDPDTSKTRYVQAMTSVGGLLSVELTDLVNVLSAAAGNLPASLPGSVIRVIAAHNGSLKLETGGKGVRHGNRGTAATSRYGTSRMIAPDGLQWIKTADADVLIVDEDSGNPYGERKYALVIDPETMTLTQKGTGYFLAMAGGKKNPRAANRASAYGGTFSRANSSEFSGTWNVSALLTRKPDGSFYSQAELSGIGEQRINATLPLARTTLIGVVQQKGESGGAVAETRADHGGQLFMFNLRLPAAALGKAAN